MPIVFGPQGYLAQFIWESGNFASGGGTTSLGLNADVSGAAAGAAIAEGLEAAWEAHMAPVTDTDYTLESIRWETETFSGEVGVAAAGTQVLTSVPPNTSILLSYVAAEKGPRNRGRQYWPGMLATGNVAEDGVITATRVNQLELATANFYQAVLAIPNVLSHAIPQSSTPGQQSPPNIPWPQVISRRVGPKAATQRRRLRR